MEINDENLAHILAANSSSERVWSYLEALGLTDENLPPLELRRLQRKALGHINAASVERLKERLEEICDTVPFFQERKNLYSPNKIKTWADFERSPLMWKDDLRRSFPSKIISTRVDLRTELEQGSLQILTTSGSTDERLQIVSKTQIERLPFGCDDLFNIPMGGIQPKTAFFMAPACSFLDCRVGKSSFEDRIINNSDLVLTSTTDPFGMDESLVRAFIEDLEKFRPMILSANPLYLQCLIRKGNAMGILFPSIPIVQSAFEFGTNCAKRDIEKAFNVQLFNDYGASEENRLAVECYRGSLHVRSDAVHIEIVNTAGACEPGKKGAILVTNFDSVTPLFRYVIGDAGAWSPYKCSCEFSSWPVIELHGRWKDMLRGENDWVSAKDVDDAIGCPTWIDFYRMTQLSLTSFEFEYIANQPEQVDLKYLEQSLSRLLGRSEICFKERKRFTPLRSLKIGTTMTKLKVPKIPE